MTSKPKKQAKISNSSTTRLPAIDVSNIDTLEKGKSAIAGLIREFYKGKIKDQKVKTLAYLLQVFLSYCRVEIEAEQVARLRRIEDRLEELGENQNRS